MFARLHENFTTPQELLDQNIVRYQSVEPNISVVNTENNYAFPNSGIDSYNQQQSNNALINSLNGVGTVPNYSVPSSRIETQVTNVGNVLTGIPDLVGENLIGCRQYTGLTGLSNLMGSSSANQAARERCGWRYKAGLGVVPQVAQGAYGNSSGPLDPAVPKKDPVGNGIKYYWNLQDAEKDMVKDICKSATTCQEMGAVPVSAIGDFKNVCGYCTTSQKIIPVKSVNGKLVPRYNDLDLQCATQNIISATESSRCPPPPPGAPEPVYMKCLNPGKLDRDCVVLTSYFAGCTPEGTLAQALSQGDNQTDYANKLRQKKSFQVYQQLANPVLNNDILKDGNTTLFGAFFNFLPVNNQMYNQDNEKLRVAAQDLCRSAGLYEQYNFCDELTDSSREFEVDCMQKEFLRQGGTTAGTKYPRTKQDAGGMNWGQYKQSIGTLVNDTRSTDPNKQREAMNQLNGLGLQMIPTDLARTADNQGVETFWYDYIGQTVMGRRPTLSSSGSNIPNFNVGGGVVAETNISDWIGFMSFFDLRPMDSTSMAIAFITDDGCAFAVNQDIFNIRDWSKAFTRWYDQGPTWHQSDCFSVNAESSKRPNIVTFAWYEKGGGAVCHPFFRYCNQGNWTEIGARGRPSSAWTDVCYLTQEVDAPSLSFEVYARNNQTVFCEKRLWSHYLPSRADSGVAYSQVPTSQFPEMPANKQQMTLINRKWATINKVALSGFYTTTVCFNIDSVDTAEKVLFAWGSARITASRATTTMTNVRFVYGNTTSQVYQIRNGTWHMATLIFNQVNRADKRINGYTFFVQTVSNLKEGKILNGIQISSHKQSNPMINEYKNDRSASALVSLGDNGLSCRIAWVHMFDDAWDTSDVNIFKKEVTASWKGRWYE